MYKFTSQLTPMPVLTMSPESEDYAITFFGGESEMLKLTPTEFYVRGQPVPIDEQEAREVYQAFRQWMIWVGLTAQP